VLYGSASFHDSCEGRPRIRWVTHSFSTSIQDVRIDHRRAHIPIAKQLLDRPDVACLCMARIHASPLRRGVLEYPGSSGMAHAVIPLREAKVVTILTPNLGGGQAFLVAKQEPERSAPVGRQEKI
jgi:hypothetical protein